MIRFTLLSLVLFTFTAAAKAQNLSGTWVAKDGQVAHYVHNGSSLSVSGNGGPANPQLSGTMSLRGGPKVFVGTYQNSVGEYRGSGNVSITIIDDNTTFVRYSGFVYFRGTKTPVSGAGYNYRKNPIVDPFVGRWTSNCTYGISTLTITKQQNGSYLVKESGLGNYTGIGYVQGRTMTITFRTANGQYDGRVIYTLDNTGKSGSGNMVWTRKPNTEKRNSNYSGTIRKIS